MFKLVLGEARNFLLEARSNRAPPRVILSLRGRFKGKKRESFHFVAVTAKRNSRLTIGKWLERGVAFRERKRVVRGYFFTNKKGGRMKDEVEGLGGRYLGPDCCNPVKISGSYSTRGGGS